MPPFHSANLHVLFFKVNSFELSDILVLFFYLLGFFFTEKNSNFLRLWTKFNEIYLVLNGKSQVSVILYIHYVSNH